MTSRIFGTIVCFAKSSYEFGLEPLTSSVQESGAAFCYTVVLADTSFRDYGNLHRK